MPLFVGERVRIGSPPFNVGFGWDSTGFRSAPKHLKHRDGTRFDFIRKHGNDPRPLRGYCNHDR